MQANQTLLLFKLIWFGISVKLIKKKKKKKERKNLSVYTGKDKTMSLNLNKHLSL